MTVEIGQSTANDSSRTFAANPDNTACCSMEQIYSPISINKSYNSVAPSFNTPYTIDTGVFNNGTSVGPTIRELNPYFTNIFGDDGSSFISYCDYNAVSHSPSEDLNLKKNQSRPSINEVRTQALRAPLMLSGWGFDLGDLPVPSLSQNRRSFDPNLINNRAYWKTGPLHLMWDDQRQVWCGGPQIVYGVLKQRISFGTVDEPSIFEVKILRLSTNQAWSGSNSFNNSFNTFDTDLGESIMCVNRHNQFTYEPSDEEIDNEEIFVVCARVNYEWTLLSLFRDSSSNYIGTFSGRWLKGSTKKVTQLKPSTNETKEVDVSNYFSDIGKDGTDTNCAYVKIKDEYFLIAAECNL